MLNSDGRRNGGAVLLVEDEALIREMLALEFEDAGFLTVQASSGDEAVALLSQGLDVTAVVTDVRMPGSIDGWGLVRWLAANRRGLPYLVTSGYLQGGELSGPVGRSLGFIAKPYKPADVVSVILAAQDARL